MAAMRKQLRILSKDILLSEEEDGNMIWLEEILSEM
jgi:hypothetical protein